MRVRALTADPHLEAMAAVASDLNRRTHQTGGQPSAHPDWCLVRIGACMNIFGAGSATACGPWPMKQSGAT